MDATAQRSLSKTPLTTTGINDLPAETLITICSLNAFRSRKPFCSSPYIAQIDSDPASDIRDTVNASHVCRRWRAILLSAPELWGHMVDPSNANLSRLLFERSQPYGISFSFSEEKRENGRNEEDFESEMAPEYQARLVEYQFKYDGKRKGMGFEYIRGSMNCRYLPRLERLSVVLPEDMHSFDLPRRFPGEATPALQRLHLHRCSPQVSSQLGVIAGTLTHLHITQVESDDPVGKWLDILATLPFLQSLSLARALMAKSHWLVNPLVHRRKPLCLNHLRELYIEDSTWRIADILHNLAFSDCLSKFSIMFYGVTEGSCANDFFGYLADLLRHMASGGLLSILKVFCGGGLVFSDVSESRVFDVQLLRQYADSEPAPSDFQGVWPNLLGRFHTALARSQTYCHAHKLVLPAFIDIVDDDVLLEVLSQCQNVRVFDEVDLPTWDFLYGCTFLRESTRREQGELLPALEEISFDISDISFETVAEDGASESETKIDATYSDHEYDSCPDEDEDDKDDRLTSACLYQAIQNLPEELLVRYRAGSVYSLSSHDSEASDGGSFHYETGDSDYEDEDSIHFGEIALLCQRRKTLQLLRFPDVPDDNLACLRERLEPFGVFVTA